MDNPLAGSSDSEDSDGSGGAYGCHQRADCDVADGIVGALTCRSTCMYVERSETLGISDGTSHAINER